MRGKTKIQRALKAAAKASKVDQNFLNALTMNIPSEEKIKKIIDRSRR